MGPTQLDSGSAPRFAAIKHGGLRAVYRGSGNHAFDAATLRTDRPVPASAAFFYFEVVVEHARPVCTVSIGFKSPATPANQQLGGGAWCEAAPAPFRARAARPPPPAARSPRLRTRSSVGYSAESGSAWHGGREIQEFHGECFDEGDAVGAGLDTLQGRVIFTKNGRVLGTGFPAPRTGRGGAGRRGPFAVRSAHVTAPRPPPRLCAPVPAGRSPVSGSHAALRPRNGLHRSPRRRGLVAGRLSRRRQPHSRGALPSAAPCTKPRPTQCPAPPAAGRRRVARAAVRAGAAAVHRDGPGEGVPGAVRLFGHARGTGCLRRSPGAAGGRRCPRRRTWRCVY